MRAEDNKKEEKVQRAPEEKKEEDKTVQKKETSAGGTTSTKSAGSYISSLPGKGQSLSPVVNRFYSSRMGYDFSNVKIHTDKEAGTSAKQLNAKAYTTGNNIVFNEGEYNTSTGEGKRLMAHELTHVIQQNEKNSTTIDRKFNFSQPAAYTETEAVKTVLDNPNLALTTPLINGTPLPDDAKQAGRIIFNAVNQGVNQERKDSKTTCSIKEPDIDVSAIISIIQKPSGTQWQGTTDGRKYAPINKACENVGMGTVYIQGKDGKKAIDVYKKVEANEKEHVSDLKKCSEKHFKGFIDFLNRFGKRQVADDEATATKECTQQYSAYVGKKDNDMINAFLTELNQLRISRDKAGGSHRFSPAVNTDGKTCFPIVVKI